MDYQYNKEEIRKAFETVREFCKDCENFKESKAKGCPMAYPCSCGDFPTFWELEGDNKDGI